MADFIITDIVSESAILSVKNLTEELNTSKAAFASYAAEIATASKESASSFADLEAKVKHFESQQNGLQQTQSAYNAQIADLKRKLNEVNASIQAATKSQQSQNQATQQAAKASEQYAKYAQSTAQANEQARAAAMEHIQAIEKQKAAMLENYGVTAEAKKAMEEVRGTYEQNVSQLHELNASIAENKSAISEKNTLLAENARLQQEAIASGNDSIQTANGETISLEQLRQQEQTLLQEKQNLLDKDRETKLEKQDLQHIIKQEEQATQAADGSYKEMSTTLTMMKDAYKRMNDEQRNSVGGKQLLQSIQMLDDKLKGTAGSMGEFQRNVGNYEQSIIAALGVNGRFATSIMGLTTAGSGMNGMLAAASTKVKAFGTALWTLVKNPVFLAVAGIGGSIAALKWLYNYNQGIAEATRLTREFTGELDNDVVTTYRNNIQAIADVYGKEFKEVLDGADTLVAQYGKSWGEALDVIDKGFAAGADLNGTFLSQIKQYAPAFRDAGVSMSQLFPRAIV